MANMVLQYPLLQLPQCCTNGGNLRHDVDTVTIFLDHPRRPANLSFYPVEPLGGAILMPLSHNRYIPLLGT